MPLLVGWLLSLVVRLLLSLFEGLTWGTESRALPVRRLLLQLCIDPHLFHLLQLLLYLLHLLAGHDRPLIIDDISLDEQMALLLHLHQYLHLALLSMLFTRQAVYFLLHPLHLDVWNYLPFWAGRLRRETLT